MFNGDNFVHSFIEFLPSYFIDAKGVFRDISERSDLKFTGIQTVDLNDCQGIFKKLKIKFTDVTMKKNVREYLRDNMLTFDVIHNNMEYTFGLYNIANMFGKDKVLVVMYHGKTGFGSYIANFDLPYFSECIIKCRGFIENPRWYYKI